MFNFHKKEAPLLGLQGSGGGLGFLAGAAAEELDLPAAYQSLIGGYSSSNRRYYDPVNGNDSNNGQTPATAKKLVGSDMNTFLDGSNGRCVILLAGTHDVSPHVSGSYGSRTFMWNTDSIVVGVPGQTIVTAQNTSQRDFHLFGMRNGGAKIYGLICRYNHYGRSTNYSRAMWGHDASYSSGQIYNCAIINISSPNTMAQIYDNNGAGNRHMEDCFLLSSSHETSYTCGTQNSYNLAFTASSSNFCSGTNSNFAHGVSHGNSPGGLPYYLTNANNATYGVYRGTYAWPSS